MTASAERLAQLQGRRDQLVELVARLADDTKQAAEVKQARKLIDEINVILRQHAPSPAPAPKPARQSSAVLAELARIRKTDRAEVRVLVREWRGRRTIDMRIWFEPKGGGEWLASRKGFSVDASKLPDLIGALMTAQQHLPSPTR